MLQIARRCGHLRQGVLQTMPGDKDETAFSVGYVPSRICNRRSHFWSCWCQGGQQSQLLLQFRCVPPRVKVISNLRRGSPGKPKCLITAKPQQLRLHYRSVATQTGWSLGLLVRLNALGYGNSMSGIPFHARAAWFSLRKTWRHY